MIPRLHVDLAAPGYRTARALQVGLVLVLLGSVAYAGWCGWETQRLRKETARHAQSVERVQGLNRGFSARLVREGLTRTPAEIEGVSARVAFANHIGRKGGFSWTRLLSDLEAAIPARASLQSVRLDVKEGAVQLTGRVRTLRDLDALAGALEQHAAFHGVQIVTHRFQEYAEERPPGKGSVRPVARTIPRTPVIVEFELTVGYEAGIPGAAS